MRFAQNHDPYLIGFGRDCRTLRHYWREQDWFGVRYSLKRMFKSARRKSWWGIWQMEWPGCQRAVRGLTYEQTRRRGVAGWRSDVHGS